MSEETAALKSAAIVSGLREIASEYARVSNATSTTDLYKQIERHLPNGFNSLMDIEQQLNDPRTPYQTVLQLRDRWVTGWKKSFHQFLRVKNANALLAETERARANAKKAGR